MDARIAVRPVAAPFEAVVGPHYDGLVRRLAFIVGDAEEAKDRAQTAYVRAFEAWSRFDGSDARAWLYTIGINLAVSELRRRSRWRRRAHEIGQEWAITVDPDLWRAIGALEPRHRAALLLNVLDGYTQAEVARMLGVPPGTVASWLSRSKALLRERLREVT
jgi:RNA polymerase sigma-70 factor (ECF subfamily)